VFAVNVKVGASNCNSIQVNVCCVTKDLHCGAECHPPVSAVDRHFTASRTVASTAEWRWTISRITRCHLLVKLIAWLLLQWSLSPDPLQATMNGFVNLLYCVLRLIERPSLKAKGRDQIGNMSAFCICPVACITNLKVVQ